MLWAVCFVAVTTLNGVQNLAKLMWAISNDGQTVYLSGGKTMIIVMPTAFYHQRINIASNTFSIIYHSNSTFYSNLPTSTTLDVSSCEWPRLTLEQLLQEGMDQLVAYVFLLLLEDSYLVHYL